MSRVLILTDDTGFGVESERSLKNRDHSVRVWTLASFDLELARDFGADVIVLDTPGNGPALSLRQRLLHDRILALVPLLVVTENPAEAQILAAQAMMTKPLESAKLERLVERLCAQPIG